MKQFNCYRFSRTCRDKVVSSSDNIDFYRLTHILDRFTLLCKPHTYLCAGRNSHKLFILEMTLIVHNIVALYAFTPSKNRWTVLPLGGVHTVTLQETLQAGNTRSHGSVIVIYRIFLFMVSEHHPPSPLRTVRKFDGG